jgi:ubiquinone/menaquinone biosynthesis C-methylase UbiE
MLDLRSDAGLFEKGKPVSTQLNGAEKLNLGCGPNAPEGWLNLDGSWNAWMSNHAFLRKVLRLAGVLKSASDVQWKVRPLVHDLTKPLPLGDNTISVIYASHVLEHLYLIDAQKLLLECNRVLRPGGLIRLVVPDLRSMAANYMNSKNGKTAISQKISAADQLNEKLGFRSPTPPRGSVLLQIYSHWKDFHHHKWMYDSDSLINYMQGAGFVDVAEKQYLESDIQCISEVEEPGRVLEGAGVCVEGKKRHEAMSQPAVHRSSAPVASV